MLPTMEQDNNYGHQRPQQSSFAPAKAEENAITGRVISNEKYTKKQLLNKIWSAITRNKKVVIIAGVAITLAILVRVFWKKIRSMFTNAEEIAAADIIAACEEEAAKQAEK